VQGKDAAVPNRADDLVSRVRFHEEALQPLDGHRVHAAGGENAGAGLGDASLADIRAEDVQRKTRPASCMDSRSRSRRSRPLRPWSNPNPDANGLARLPIPQDRGKGGLFSGFEDGRVAEELGDVDEKVVGEGPHLGGILLQDLEVLIGIAGLLHDDPPLHPAQERIRLILRKSTPTVVLTSRRIL